MCIRQSGQMTRFSPLGRIGLEATTLFIPNASPLSVKAPPHARLDAPAQDPARIGGHP